MLAVISLCRLCGVDFSLKLWHTIFCLSQVTKQLLQPRNELEEMRESADAQVIKTASASLQFLIAKPSESFDPHAALAALEHLVIVAKEKKDTESEKYATVLSQCRPLVGRKPLQSVLVKLVASKQEAN